MAAALAGRMRASGLMGPGGGTSRSARRRMRRRLGLVGPLKSRKPQMVVDRFIATPARGVRRRRNRASRRLNALRRAEALSSNGEGFAAVGPSTEIGNVWTNRKFAGADGLSGMSLGSTAAGRSAAAKALHPAADLGPQRWPDKSANETLVLQNTLTLLINSNGGTGTTWACQLWLTNFIDCPLITSSVQDANYSNPNATMNNASCGTGQQPGKAYAFHYDTQWANSDTTKHPGNDYQTARITARSMTVDLVANATTNQGVVYAAQFSPNHALMPEVGGPGLERFVDKLLDRKLELKLKKIKEEKEDDSGSDVEPEVDEEIEELITKINRFSWGPSRPQNVPSGNESGYRLVFQDYPYNPQQIMQMSPASYMAKAEKGTYMTLKHASDTIHYSPTSVECYLSATVPHTSTSQTSQMNVLASDGWMMGAAIFTGLAEPAVLSVKVITCLELTPRSDSQMAKFAEEAPPLDKMAMDHTRAAMGQLPDAFPACDNVLGGIVEWIAGALERSGLPIVSQAAGFARRANATLGYAGTKFLDTIF